VQSAGLADLVSYEHREGMDFSVIRIILGVK
jgi:hypothetical protein